MGNADNLGSEAKGEREDNREQTAGKQERVKRRVNNLKGILFFLFIACLLSVAVTTLIPFKRGIAGEYTADVVSLSTHEKTGEAQIRFSGTYTQYLFNMMFRDRFEGAFYVEGNPLSDKYGGHAFIDFEKAFSPAKTGVVCYYNEEDNRLEPMGMINQRAQMQSGYLILNTAMTEGEDDLVLVFPQNHSGVQLDLEKYLGL
ncbi:MAG: hypothetical protein NC399_02560 [Muribaculum sp.]|nr:hypothetical protein [Muribaculum sp.]